MPARFLSLLLLPLLWLAGCTSGPGGAGTEANRFSRTIVIQGDFPVLANGMSADELRQKLGEPAEIRPMKAAEGNPEVWVYYLEKHLGKTQVVNFMSRPASTGSFTNDALAGIPEPVYTFADRKLSVTLQLLMFNGRLASQAAKSEERLEF